MRLRTQHVSNTTTAAEEGGWRDRKEMKKLLPFGHPFKRYLEMACHGNTGCALGFHERNTESLGLRHVCVIDSLADFRAKFQYSLEKEVLIAGRLADDLFHYIGDVLSQNPDQVLAFERLIPDQPVLPTATSKNKGKGKGGNSGGSLHLDRVELHVRSAIPGVEFDNSLLEELSSYNKIT